MADRTGSAKTLPQAPNSSGECALSQLASASSTLVCHPGPVAPKRLTISGDRRIVMRFFSADFWISSDASVDLRIFRFGWHNNLRLFHTV
jgi:hypothetical protein